jgi:hypothetical protein
MMMRVAVPMRGTAAIVVAVGRDQDESPIIGCRGPVGSDTEHRSEQGEQAGNHRQTAEEPCALVP